MSEEWPVGVDWLRRLKRRVMGEKKKASGSAMTVTLQEAVNAIVKNGLPKYQGWESKKDGKVVAACSIAQGAINLGCTYVSLASALAGIYVFNGDRTEVTLKSYIMSVNDTTTKSVEDIGKEAARRVKALPDMPLIVYAR